MLAVENLCHHAEGDGQPALGVEAMAARRWAEGMPDRETAAGAQRHVARLLRVLAAERAALESEAVHTRH